MELTLTKIGFSDFFTDESACIVYSCRRIKYHSFGDIAVNDVDS